MICTEEYFNEIAKSINPDKFNILLIGVYPNMGDKLFHLNKKLIDAKSFLFNNEQNDYTFLSHHWLTSNYYGNKDCLQGYRDIYIDMNDDKSVYNLVQSELHDVFDVVFVDSFVLCHVKDIFNFYELAMSLIKNKGILLLKKQDVEFANILFNEYETSYYNLNESEEDNSPFIINNYYYNDLISMKITINK